MHIYLLPQRDCIKLCQGGSKTPTILHNICTHTHTYIHGYKHIYISHNNGTANNGTAKSSGKED